MANRSEREAAAQRRYWRFNLLAIALVLACSMTVSLLPALLNLAAAHGLPWRWRPPFALAAQGAILCYIALTVGYALLMAWRDRRLAGELAEAEPERIGPDKPTAASRHAHDEA